MKIEKFCLFLLIFLAGCTVKPTKVTIGSLLDELTKRENLTYYPLIQYSHQQQSSYNRKSVAPDQPGWDANADMSHFIRVEQNHNRREFVMFDAEGPGAIVRWWMTFYVAQTGVIRIYLDGNPVPVAEGTADKLLSSNLLAPPPFAVSVHEGVPVKEVGRDMDHNFYLPIPFSKHCKITFENDSLQLTPEGNYFPDVFYNIGYRKYNANVQVESFSLAGLEEAKPFIGKAAQALTNYTANRGTTNQFEKKLAPGDSVSLSFSESGKAVNYLEMKITGTDSLQYLRSTVLTASFDGRQTIWAPVGEFFGTGCRLFNHKTWMNGSSENGIMYSNWIMPFQKSCILTLTNYGDSTVIVSGLASLGDYEWRSNSMYFGSAWREYYHINSKDEQGFDLNFVELKGQGVYVGDQITLFNTSYEWWGEGDEKIFVDDEAFPSVFGTGTEDYYGYAFGRPQPFSHPFISQPVGNGNEGNSSNGGLTVNIRHRGLDAIPFTKSIKTDMELWHWAAAPLNYAATTYWYAFSPIEVNVKPDINSVRNRVAQSTADFKKK